MILLIGGVGQGKLDYARKKIGLTGAGVATCPADARTKPIFAHLEAWVREHPEGDLGDLLEVNPGLVILCDEVGCGVVPMDPGERAWREAVGRLCCALAQKADRVERIFCGIPMVLKGEGTWK